MTIKDTTTTPNNTFKVVRKTHPNLYKYPGRPTMETSGAFLQAIECLEKDEVDEVILGTYVGDEEVTAELFDIIQKADILGLCLQEDGKGWVADRWEVLETFEGEDKILCKSVLRPHLEEREIFFEDVAIALLFGRAEILYRDDKPFGLSKEDVEITVTIKNLNEEKKDSQEQNSQQEVDDTEK